jgi:hypothetical protein
VHDTYREISTDNVFESHMTEEQTTLDLLLRLHWKMEVIGEMMISVDLPNLVLVKDMIQQRVQNIDSMASKELKLWI